MNQMQNPKASAANEIDEYECSGNGPRPPVPGKESRTTKMMEPGSSSSSNVPVNPCAQAASVADDLQAECVRVRKWRDKLSNLLADKAGNELFETFVRDNYRPEQIQVAELEMYFACEGLKQQTNPKLARQFIGAIYRKFLLRGPFKAPDASAAARKIIKKEMEPDVNIYHDLQCQIEKKIEESTYPEFFTSPIYFAYATQVQDRYEALNNNCGARPAQVAGGSSYSPYGSDVASGGITLSGAIGSSLQESLLMNSVLPTLHEDTELTIHDDVSTKSLGGRSFKPKLTKESLLRTQSQRLNDVRPANAHGYSLKFNESFNPSSRQDSNRQSCSSASQTDSDTKSLVSSKDGQPYIHRKSSRSDPMKNCYMNPMSDANRTLVGPITRERLEASKQMEPEKLVAELWKRLKPVIEEQDQDKQLNRRAIEADGLIDEPQMCTKSFASTAGLSAAHQFNHQAITNVIFRKIPSIDADSDQAILDQHVSRVFSPHVQSPGTASPRQPASISRPPPPLPHRIIDPLTDYGSQSMGARMDQAPYGGSVSRKADKNPSTGIYYDSGISMNSAEYRPTKAEAIEKTRSILEGAALTQSQQQSRSRHQSAFQPQSNAASHHTNSLSRMRDHGGDYTYTMYQFCDEKVPYRTKLRSKEPTLKMFKEALHKKGNFRYFFKIPCEELQAVQEEFTCDSDILPLFEGKVMGMVMPQ